MICVYGLLDVVWFRGTAAMPWRAVRPAAGGFEFLRVGRGEKDKAACEGRGNDGVEAWRAPRVPSPTLELPVSFGVAAKCVAARAAADDTDGRVV